jgi:hypothetical protein
MPGNNFAFKSRMSNVDWALLHQAVQEDKPDLPDTAWIIHQVTQFCKNVALPLLERHHPPAPLGPAKMKIEKTIWIPERSFEGTTNHEVLERFAEFKGKPTTQIIQRYIIDPKVVEQELRLLRRLR